MDIPKNLQSKEVKKSKCIRIIRAQQRAIKSLCFECQGARTELVEGCPGERLPNGEPCSLYPFRPQRRKK